MSRYDTLFQDLTIQRMCGGIKWFDDTQHCLDLRLYISVPISKPSVHTIIDSRYQHKR